MRTRYWVTSSREEMRRCSRAAVICGIEASRTVKGGRGAAGLRAFAGDGLGLCAAIARAASAAPIKIRRKVFGIAMWKSYQNISFIDIRSWPDVPKSPSAKQRRFVKSEALSRRQRGAVGMGVRVERAFVSVMP